MRTICNSRLLALAALFGLSAPAWAQLVIRAGPVTVRVGQGVGVEAGPVRVRVGQGVGVDAGPVRVRVGQGVGVEVLPNAMPARVAEAAPLVQPPQGVPLEIAPPAPPVPLPGASTSRPPTIQEFAGGFKPSPGKHEAIILHPYSNCPVKVSFCLPDGCPKVCVKGCLRRAVEFNYGSKDIQIWFYRDGRVKVNN